MARMIDADAMLEYLNLMYDKQNDSDEPFNCAVLGAINYIKHKAPTIDAVSVVRCGECKHSETSEDNSLYCKHWDDHFGFFWDEVKSDDYCSCGERKDHE